MDAELLLGLLTLAGGVIGYFIREYRTRALPFMSLLSTQGDFRKNTSRVQIADDIVKDLQSTHYIRKLTSEDTLQEVHKSWNEANGISKVGKDFFKAIESVRDAARAGDQDSLSESLVKLLSSFQFDKWLSILIFNGDLSIPAPNPNLPARVDVFMSDEYGGTLCMVLPTGTATLGSGLGKSAFLKRRLELLTALIERLDCDAVSTVFTTLMEWWSHEEEVANKVKSALRGILDENSQWEIQLYMANLGPTPLLVETRASLVVKDDSGAAFSEHCYMVLLTHEEGQLIRQDADTPLILRGQSDATVSFFTEATQGEMKRGRVFREVFASGDAECRLGLFVQKVGLFRKVSLTTPSAAFRSPGSE